MKQIKMFIRYELLRKPAAAAGFKKDGSASPPKKSGENRIKQDTKNHRFHCHSVFPIVKEAKEGGGSDDTLKLTEEKWLLSLYKQEYADYLKRVNRCIPWLPRKG